VNLPDASAPLARRFEGLRLKSYLCPAGVWTVGYGATGRDVGPGMVVTPEWAEARLYRDLMAFMPEVLKACPVLLTEPPDRLASILDFTFNLGGPRLRASTLRRRVNARDWPGAQAELAKWVRGGGRVLPGLVLRRAADAALL
jgi:lysozyme